MGRVCRAGPGAASSNAFQVARIAIKVQTGYHAAERTRRPMIFVPLPFVAALLLLLLLARMIRERGNTPAIRPFLLLIAGYALLSVVIGLRWGYGVVELAPVMPVLATAMPPLAFIAFSGLAVENRWSLKRAAHFIPPVVVAALIPAAPWLIDGLLIAVFLAYGIALLALAARGPDALTGVTLDRSALVHKALIAAGIMLILSALVDAVIAIDFMRSGGVHAARYVGFANILNLLFLGAAAAIAGPSQPAGPADEADGPPPSGPNDEDRDVAARIEALVTEKQLYRDPELTLNRIARKALIPARRISNAINRTRGESVSQYINGHRIAEACRLLAATDRPVTAVMFDSGFQTKSNFNREFLRRKGTSPAEWRANRARAA
jgi:AraC-like DNA-binding protein